MLALKAPTVYQHLVNRSGGLVMLTPIISFACKPGRRCFVLSALFCLLLATGAAAAPNIDTLDAAVGLALFEKNWVSAPASTTASDGLGPFYNARSCVVCHPGAGRGQTPVALNFISADPVYGQLIQQQSVGGLRSEARVLVGVTEHTVAMSDNTEVVMHSPSFTLSELRYGPLQHELSARLAPSLHGLVLLEQITQEQIALLADPLDADADGISGRVAWVRNTQTGVIEPGRFGWKASVSTLNEQIGKALSLDMGLGNPLFPNSYGDCTLQQQDCLQLPHGNSPDSKEPEVSAIALNLLLVYVRSLTADSLKNGTEAVVPSQGSVLFDTIGCVACHRRQWQAGVQLITPYTDLLLHDLGPALATANKAATEVPDVAEWRTAPLWGLSSNLSYLHDGRATSISEAILWHSGEAEGSVQAYKNLDKAAREVLHSWLNGL